MAERENPYEAPRATATPSASVGGPLDELYSSTPDGFLVVDSEKKIPAVCLKCAATQGITRRTERLAVAGSSAAVGGLGGVMGAMVASQLRHAGEFLIPTLVGAGLVVGIVAWITNARTVRVELQLPLCETCDSVWTEGVNYRTGLLVGMGLSALGVVPGIAMHEMWWIAAGLAVFAGALVMALVVKIPARFVVARRINATRVYLAGVDSGVPGAIARRRAERKAKRERERAQERERERDDSVDGDEA